MVVKNSWQFEKGENGKITPVLGQRNLSNELLNEVAQKIKGTEVSL